MRSFKLVVMGLVPLLLVLSANADIYDELEIKVTRLSDKAIIVSTQEGSGPQVALATDKGLVVMSTLSSPGLASKYRGIIEGEFGRNDFTYVINNWDRLDVVGGNPLYSDAVIIAHEHARENLMQRSQNLDHHLQDLIDMWEWKAGLSEGRLKDYDPNSEDAKSERVWLAYCRRMVDDLSEGYELVLPTLTFTDHLTLDLGDLTLKLHYFGKASYESGFIIHVPEEKLLFTGFLFHRHYLAPTPNRYMVELDVPRWLEVLDAVLTDEDAVERVVCGPSQVYPREWLVGRRDYMRQLWEEVKAANEAGLDLDAIQERLSLEDKFVYVKEWDIYAVDGPEWTLEEHTKNVRLFWLQFQTFASEVIEQTLTEAGVDVAIKKYYEIKSSTGNEYYFDEYSFNALGYKLLGEGKVKEAIEIFRLNVEAYPGSSNVYDSLGEAYMINDNKKLAIKNYKQSLELNPENTNAVEMLKRLEKK